MKRLFTAVTIAILATTSVGHAEVPQTPSIDITSDGDGDIVVAVAFLAILGLILMSRKGPQTCPQVSDQTYTGGKADTDSRPSC